MSQYLLYTDIYLFDLFSELDAHSNVYVTNHTHTYLRVCVCVCVHMFMLL